MLKKGLDYYTPRIKNAVEQTLVKDQNEPHNLSKGELLEIIWSADSKYEKFVSLLRILKDVLPKSLTDIEREKLKDFLYSLKELPFNPEKFNLESLDNGGQSKVFLLEAKENDKQSFVLKIIMPDKDGKDPMDQIKLFKAEYEYLKELYKDVPDLIPEEYFLLLRDPQQKNRTAPALIQPFMGKDIKDFFDFTTTDLKDRYFENPKLREQIESFSGITIEHERKTGEVIDMLGPKNVCLTKNNGAEKLTLLDPHFIYSTPLETEDKKRRLEERLEFLNNF